MRKAIGRLRILSLVAIATGLGLTIYLEIQAGRVFTLRFAIPDYTLGEQVVAITACSVLLAGLILDGMANVVIALTAKDMSDES